MATVLVQNSRKDIIIPTVDCSIATAFAVHTIGISHTRNNTVSNSW